MGFSPASPPPCAHGDRQIHGVGVVVSGKRSDAHVCMGSLQAENVPERSGNQLLPAWTFNDCRWVRVARGDRVKAGGLICCLVPLFSLSASPISHCSLFRSQFQVGPTSFTQVQPGITKWAFGDMGGAGGSGGGSWNLLDAQHVQPGTFPLLTDNLSPGDGQLDNASLQLSLAPCSALLVSHSLDLTPQ